MYICSECLCEFETPKYIDCSFDTRFGVVKTGYHGCPECESPDYETVQICPKCDAGHMRRADRLCPKCRRELLARICGFFDTLTYEECLLFDDLIEGDVIENRNKWEV